MPDFEHQQDLPPDRSALRVDRAKPRSEAKRNVRITPRQTLSLEDYLQGIRKCDRAVLGRAITLIESHAPQHQAMAAELLTQLMPETGGSLRLGITGVPGVGKSTFIERFGTNLTRQGKRVAVLAIDPSSGVSGGSVLGDKTRMAHLAVEPNAFIRPSPAGRTLGGVTRKTRETMLLCEAAGFDVVLIETVGVGQSETVVSEMTDFFLALMLPGAGDELQGIKRGLLELVDMIAVNKADGDRVNAAKQAVRDYRNALRSMQRNDPDWSTPVVTCSAANNQGLAEIWQTIYERYTTLQKNGALQKQRKKQQLRWMWSLIEDQIMDRLRHDEKVVELLASLEPQIHAGNVPPTRAAEQILNTFLRNH